MPRTDISHCIHLQIKVKVIKLTKIMESSTDSDSCEIVAVVSDDDALKKKIKIKSKAEFSRYE